MFIAALFTIAKIWKQTKSPSTDEWIKKMWYIYIYTHICMCVYMCVHTHTHTHTMEYYSAIKKNEILPFTTTWMNLEGTILSEISQRERQILYDITFLWNLNNKTN